MAFQNQACFRQSSKLFKARKDIKGRVWRGRRNKQMHTQNIQCWTEKDELSYKRSSVYRLIWCLKPIYNQIRPGISTGRELNQRLKKNYGQEMRITPPFNCSVTAVGILVGREKSTAKVTSKLTSVGWRSQNQEMRLKRSIPDLPILIKDPF